MTSEVMSKGGTSSWTSGSHPLAKRSHTDASLDASFAWGMLQWPWLNVRRTITYGQRNPWTHDLLLHVDDRLVVVHAKRHTRPGIPLGTLSSAFLECEQYPGGTGSFYPDFREWLRSSSLRYDAYHRPSGGLASAVAAPVADMVAAIRASLSLRVTELAAILHVERPTVYAWIRGDSTPLDHNYQRLAALFDLARWWERVSDKALGSAVRQAFPDEEPIVTLLTREELPVDQARDRLRELISAERQQRQRFDKDRPRPGVFARRRGFDLPSKEEQQDRLSVETGKRLGPD